MDRPLASASAPTKLILFGEHFVVYGAPGIAVSSSPRNHVEVGILSGGPGLQIVGDLGGMFVSPGGETRGDGTLGMFATPYLFLLERGFGKDCLFEAKISRDCACKGMGNSSSIGAALGVALFAAVGQELDKEGAFECAQRVDQIAHGAGRPSGIDARTVVEGKPQMFIRHFSPPSFEFKSIRVKPPPGFGFVVIDTYRGAKSKTGDLIQVFGDSVKARGPPDSLSDEERKDICRPYMEIYEKAEEKLVGGSAKDARLLGSLMNKNHELLSERGVSTDSIEAVREACLGAGAFGAKISGAGGLGGAVIAIGDEKARRGMAGAVKKIGFCAFDVRMADRGVTLEK